MRHCMCKELNREALRDANNGRFATDPNNHASDRSCERCEHAIKSCNIDEKNSARSLLPINSLQRCLIAHRNNLEDTTTSTVRKLNREEATTARTDLNLAGGAQERGTSQGYACVQKSVRSL